MIPSRMKHGRAISAFCFGTVQLGMPYGIANRTGMPDAALAEELLAAAYAAGVTTFDTARAYGEAEARLGAALPVMPQAIVITKLDPLEGIAESGMEEAAEKSVRDSLQALGLSALPYLLLHRAVHLQAGGGKVWKRLLNLRKQGVIERLGVSVQSPEEALSALRVPEVECIQLPFNLLDKRYERAGIPALLAKRPEVLVMARSILLQGVLTQDAGSWPVLPPEEARSIAQALDKWVVTFGRKNRVDLCLAYVRAQPWIDTVVIGMENTSQLEENLALFQVPPLSEEACRTISGQFLHLGDSFLNPALWPKRNV